MLAFAVPAFLLAGALAALVPLALHLIRRRPPARAPLPTQRFLSEDPRTSVRVSRPTDLLLLALRMLLLVLAGAAFARPRWLPAPKGTSEVVLLDRGAAMAPSWPRAVEHARRALLAPDGTARGELVLFDTAAARIPRRRVTPALFDSLAAARPGTGPVSYAAALRSVLPAARELRGADSVRVTLLTAPRWSAWSDGLAALRRSAWRGAVAMPELGATLPADTASTPSVEPRRATVIGLPGAQGQFVTPALAATGWMVARAAVNATLGGDSADLYVVLNPPLAPTSAALEERARAGATVVVSANAAERGMLDVLPWTPGAARAEPAGTLWLAGGPSLAGAAGRRPGAPKPGASVIAAWDDGRPGAAAARVGRGCVVYLSADLEGGELPFSAAYPRALDRLARGCESSADDEADAPLDAGARAVLRGQGPAAVAASAIPGSGGGVSLGRWILVAALAVALIETWIAYRRRTA